MPFLKEIRRSEFLLLSCLDNIEVIQFLSAGRICPRELWSVLYLVTMLSSGV